MYIILGSDGKHYGPVTAGNVIEWMRDGRANLQTKARRAEETEWKSLAEFAEFAPSRSSPPLPPTLTELTPPDEASRSGTPAVQASVNPDALPPAGLMRRFFAALIDGVLQWLCWMPAGLAASAALADHTQAHGQPGLEFIMQTMVAATPKSLPYLLGLAVLQITLLTLRSQSVGKMILGIRIVTVREEAPGGFLRAFLLRGFPTWLIKQVPIIGLIYWAVDSFCIFREDQRCLHDLIAGTKVVKRE
jgi:uncharacterized RDD family membrane protein YckC